MQNIPTDEAGLKKWINETHDGDVIAGAMNLSALLFEKETIVNAMRISLMSHYGRARKPILPQYFAFIPRLWRHLKRGSSYTELARGELQVATRPVVEGDILVAYIAEDQKIYYREQGEFEDGRFEEIKVAP